MSDHTPDAVGGPTLTRAIRTMPKWKVLLLVGSLVVGVLGVGAQVASKNLHQAQPQTVTVRTTTPGTPGAAPPGASGFMGGAAQPPAADQQTTTTTTVPATPTLTDTVSPYVAKVGFSFFVGIVVGLISRTFLKIATLLAGLAIAAVIAAHYFNINVDLTAVKAQTGEATTWLNGQLGQMKDFIFAHLPSAGGATAGFLFGMKRR